MNKIAEIIPRIRIIPQLGIFDYETTSPVKVGQIVLVEFHRKKVPGLIWKIKDKTSIKKIKKIIRPMNIFLEKKQLELIKWLSKTYKISLALALKTILPEIPKKWLN